MADAEQHARMAQLTAEMAWLRRLARALLRTDEAADLAQDAWLVAVEHAPTDGRPLRPWLSRVALNLTRMRARARQRRETRELASASLVERVASPDELVQRVELQRHIAGEVLQLAEPYRSTVLLHFFEELSCAEIARRLELPEGTVRRRLKVALDELRARLDRNGSERGGLAALVPLAATATPAQTASFAVGVLAMKKLVAAIVILLVVLIATLMWRGHGGDNSQASSGATSGDRAALAPTGHAGAHDPDPELPAWLAQRDVPPRRIAGRVTFHGAPVSGATVEMASIASDSGLVEAPHRITSASGEFDFGPHPAMELSVRASAPGKTSASVSVDLRNPTERPPSDRLELELGACSAALVGTVRDASGGAIAKARITRLAAQGGWSPTIVNARGATVVTDDKGAYEMCVEAKWPGWVAIEVAAHGYGSITFTSIVPGRVKADFALVPEATIVGRVIRDDTRAPVPQAYVYLPAGRPGVESTAWRGAFADGNGHFKIDGVAPGQHLLFARGDGLVATSRGTLVVVEAGQTTSEIEIRLEAGSTIRGVVVDHGKPVAGAHVAPASVDGGRSTTSAVSQQDGSFVLAEVPHGDIRFTAFPYDVVKPTTFHVSEREHAGVVIEVDTLGTIVGHVTRNKKPVPGANIEIHGPNDRELDVVRTNGEGRFEAVGLRPGPWMLYASNEHEGSYGGPEHVELGRGQTAEVTIDLAFAAAISGRVVDQHDAPVPGVVVWFRNTKTDDGGVSVTSFDGSFRAATLTGGGQYRPQVRLNSLSTVGLKPAGGAEFPLVTVADRSSEVTDIVLAVQLDHLAIAGKVVDSDGAAVPDARVLAEQIDHGEQPHFFAGIQDAAATTDVDGRFAIGDLLAGGYAVRARSSSGAEATITDVAAGRTDVTLVLPISGAIDGTLVGFKDLPQVSATKGSSAAVFASVQGTGFHVRDLSPGSYLVTARTATEAASAIVEVSSGRSSQTTLTSRGSGVVSGHVRDFRSGKPIEGMTCRALSRVGMIPTMGVPGEGVRSDAQGAFLISAAPTGDIAVSCDGLWRLYSDGVRRLTLQASQPADVDVPVVAWANEVSRTIAGFGAELDYPTLVPTLVRVQPSGPAAIAGFQNGDVVISVDGASVTELSEDGVLILIVNRAPGTKVKIGVTRAGKIVNGELVLGEAPR